MPRRQRRQRVTLRFKRRVQLNGRWRTALARGVAAALAAGFVGGLATSRDSCVSRFIRRHIPRIEVNTPQVLAGLPVLGEIPKNPFWLWLPGSGFWLQTRVCRAHHAVRAVRLERHFEENRVVVRLAPRVPLVVWNGAGFDREGVLFAMTPGTWDAVPQASFLASADKGALQGWLARVSAISDLWPQVLSVRQLPDESLELALRTGTVVVWGAPETGSVARKAQTLERVLDDAHQHMAGAARADLRFFDQGRIIVLPKGK